MKPIRITLVVGATIVLMVSLAWVWPGAIDGGDRAERHHKFDESSMNAIAQLVLEFRSVTGRLPEESIWREELLTLDRLEDKEEGIFDDSWGRAFQYRNLDDGSRFEIATFGRGGAKGGVGEEKDLAVTGPD